MRKLLLVAVCTAIAVPARADVVRIAALAADIDKSAADEVPALIDDYVLTAIQGIGGMEVVGLARRPDSSPRYRPAYASASR
jgi:hypothetical protein